MVLHKENHIFIGDIVDVWSLECSGKVVMFYTEASAKRIYLMLHTCLLLQENNEEIQVLLHQIDHSASLDLYIVDQGVVSVLLSEVSGLTRTTFKIEQLVKEIDGGDSYTNLSQTVRTKYSYSYTILFYILDHFLTVHPTKAKATELQVPVITVPIHLFCDDTSGNHGKKWNKFVQWKLIMASCGSMH